GFASTTSPRSSRTTRGWSCATSSTSRSKSSSSAGRHRRSGERRTAKLPAPPKNSGEPRRPSVVRLVQTVPPASRGDRTAQGSSPARPAGGRLLAWAGVCVYTASTYFGGPPGGEDHAHAAVQPAATPAQTPQTGEVGEVRRPVHAAPVRVGGPPRPHRPRRRR